MKQAWNLYEVIQTQITPPFKIKYFFPGHLAQTTCIQTVNSSEVNSFNLLSKHFNALELQGQINLGFQWKISIKVQIQSLF